ncbi:MAG: ABC transporter substrate-binding protein [Ignavibacteriaceae bacterium]|nr:ABC transporter substrate-binding protein [Ignavibacteriaceae bacterium]
MFILLLISGQLFAQRETGGLRKVTLQLKWKHQFQFAGYYAAVEKGFYRRAGLDVQLKEAELSRDPKLEVMNGNAEFGIATSDILFLQEGEINAVVLAAIFQHSPQILLASQKAGVNNVHRLSGKTIAMEPNAADLIAYLSDEGITPDKYATVPHEFGITQLTDNTADAISAYATDEPYLLEKSGFSYTILSPLSGGIDFYGDVLFTTSRMIENQPELVESFRKASLEGWKYALSNKSEIIDLILEKYSKRHSKEHLEFEASKTDRYIVPEIIEIGYSNPGRWESILSIYKRLGKINQHVSTERMFYSHYQKTDTPLPWGLISVYSLLTFAVAGVAYFFYSVSRRLKKEIREKEIIRLSLMDAKNKYQTLVDNANEGVVVVCEGQYRYVNNMMVSLTGYTSDELHAGKFTDFFHPEDKAVAEERYRKRIDDEKLLPSYDYRMIRKDGALRWVNVSGVKIDWDGKPATLNFLTDITERKNAEAVIQKQNRELTDANITKDKFFSLIAHDLRAPFHGFLGLTDLMIQDIYELSREEMITYLQTIQKSANTVYTLLDNLLQWAKMQRGLIEFNPVNTDLALLIEDVSSIYQGSTAQKDISMIYNLQRPLFAYADSSMLSTVLRNLISNAIKFTFEGGEIIITAGSENHSVFVSVKDSGKGMPPEVVERLFRLDQKITTPGTAGETGSGLGLHLTKDFIEMHSGQITVESKPGEGSTFTFMIPVINIP